MAYQIRVLPQQCNISAEAGDDLLTCLRSAGLMEDAPCGGNGSCGKCKVLVNGEQKLACQTKIDGDMVVTVPQALPQQILTQGIDLPPTSAKERHSWALALDIGTTTVVGYLLQGSTAVGCQSRRNPQTAFGADVITRIRHALQGQQDALTACIRQCVNDLTLALCREARICPDQLETVCFVGNPAMQQFFLGIPPANLVQLPFPPMLTQARLVPAIHYIPCCHNARLQIVPDIAGFVGADLLAGILSTGMDRADDMTLLVDIGTNGEMVLGNRHRLVACSTAAGPALEGGNISCGLRARAGAIDHAWAENDRIGCHVMGGVTAEGICGSGLIDATASALELGWINKRGRVLTPDHCIPLIDGLCLTQADIRQLQLAKGAICAGIVLLAQQLDIQIEQIQRVYLAGAFGSCLDPKCACRIGLLPPALEHRITAVGNAAGSGAKLLAFDPNALAYAQQLLSRIEFTELAQLPAFPKTFAREMGFAVP